VPHQPNHQTTKPNHQTTNQFQEKDVLHRHGAVWLDFTAEGFKAEVERVQMYFVSQMTVPTGIARNEALCENLFMILVSVLNKIPIFVVGVPGSSKSLAVRLIQSNLRGQASVYIPHHTTWPPGHHTTPHHTTPHHTTPPGHLAITPHHTTNCACMC
jgi:hypothetical protein